MATLTLTSLSDLGSGETSDADSTMEAFYSDGYGDNSFEIINGRLDEDNLSGTRPIGSSQIKNNALAGGRMVGSTGNIDYFSVTFPELNTDIGAYMKVPGCSISFFLPYDCSVVMFTWSVSGNSTQDYNSSGAVSTTDVAELKFYLDGTFPNNQFRSFPPSHDKVTSNNPLQAHRFRIWSGHHMEQDMAKGWHSAYIGFFTNDDMTRFRIRNMKAIWFK